MRVAWSALCLLLSIIVALAGIACMCICKRTGNGARRKCGLHLLLAVCCHYLGERLRGVRWAFLLARSVVVSVPIESLLLLGGRSCVLESVV